MGRTVVYAVAVNCLKNPTPNPNPHPKPNPIRNPTTNPIPTPNPNPTNPIPYSSGNLLLRRKLHLALYHVMCYLFELAAVSIRVLLVATSTIPQPRIFAFYSSPHKQKIANTSSANFNDQLIDY